MDKNEAFELDLIAPLDNNIDKFEIKLIKNSDIKSVTVLSLGASEIHLALRLYHVVLEDTVFCLSLTFFASVNSILSEDATPVLINSEPKTLIKYDISRSA